MTLDAIARILDDVIRATGIDWATCSIALYTYTIIDWWLGQSAERAALAEIREIVQAAMDASDLSKLDLPRILELCGKEEQ